MKIAIIGTGYVGLVTGTCFAEMGVEVSCVDIDEKKVSLLSQGKITIYEPGLENIFLRNLQQQRLQFTTSLADGIADAQLIFLALPTPSGEDGSADLSYVLQTAEKISTLLKKYTVIVNKSTVPVGTADKVKSLIQKKCSVEFDVVSNPEFLREGVAVEDFMKPERVIIGVESERARKLMEQLYQPFVRQGNPILMMDIRSAELTKYAANAFLAMKISYMNEIANLCERSGADIDAVRKGIGTDSRIGKRFIFPGIGYGGSCFPKDVLSLTKTAEELQYDFKILNAVLAINKTQKTILIPKIKEYFNGDVKNKVIAFWGLAFKPQTDDIREAPALDNIHELLALGATIHAHDPEANNNVKKILGDSIQYFQDPYSAAKKADALFIATEWSEFRMLNLEKLASEMNQKVIFDGRNVYEPKQMEELGFAYFSIGRKTVYGKK